MKCGKCGNIIDENLSHCPNCGNNIDEDKIKDILDSSNDISIPKIIMAVIIVLLVIVSIYYLVVGIHNDMTVVGTWKCADYAENINPKNKDIYYFKLDFLENNSFKQYSINKVENTFEINGTYSEKVSNKVDENMYGYLDVYLASKSITRNGITNNSEITDHYEFGILKDRDSAIVINTKNYSTYYCVKD